MAKIDFSAVEKNLINWLQAKVDSAGAQGAVVGLSGGIDSSVTAGLCQKAFGDNVLGVIMPCHSGERDEKDAEMLSNKFDIKSIKYDMSEVYDHFLDGLKTKGVKGGKVAEANIKPRLRMTALYYYAASLNYLVIGTDNRSELKIGYFTKYGDGGIDLAPLGSLVKSEVKELAERLDIPESIITKKPSAGLWRGQTDEDEMGFSYEELDKYILTGEAEDDVKKEIDKLAEKNRHKLAPIPIPERKDMLSES